jgi:hypothetical protein
VVCVVVVNVVFVVVGHEGLLEPRIEALAVELSWQEIRRLFPPLRQVQARDS